MCFGWSRRLVWCGVIFVAEIETKMRLGARTGNFEGHFGSRPMLTEKWVDRLKQNGLPASHHLREFRVKPEPSVKIKGVAIQTVLAGNTRVCSGHGEL